MSEYAYKEIIIDPTSEEARNCIGKMVYYADNPSTCLSNADNEYDNFCDILLEIDTSNSCPFVLGSRGTRWQCIIARKEEPKPEYIPFDTVEEFVKASLIHNKEHYLSGTGIWIKEPHSEDSESCISMVNGLCTYDNTVYVDDRWMNLNQILKSYSFLDDTQCGKLKENI